MTDFYPFNPALGQIMQTDVDGITADRAFFAHVSFTADDAVVADTDGVHAAVTDTGAAQDIITGITNPPCARNVTATAGGTAADIGAIQVVVEGTDLEGNAITETLPAFTVNTAGTVVGNKAFATVTKITIPAHDGTGATTAIGFGDKLGLPYKRATLPCVAAYLGGVLESTAATVASSATAISSNTIDLNSALNGSAVDVYLVV